MSSSQAGSTNPPPSEGVVAERKCGRCRQRFAADPHRVDGTIADWWLCDPCHLVLFGEDRHAPGGSRGS